MRLYAPALPVYRDGIRTRRRGRRWPWMLLNPLGIGCVAVVAWFAYASLLITNFLAIFDELGAELPWTTYFMVNAQFMLTRKCVPIVAAAWLAGSLLGLPLYFRPQLWKRFWIPPLFAFFTVCYLIGFLVLCCYLPLFNIPKLIR